MSTPSHPDPSAQDPSQDPAAQDPNRGIEDHGG